MKIVALNLWSVALAALCSSGCASIVSRSKYNIPIYSNAPTRVEIHNRGKYVTTVNAPSIVTLSSKSAFFVPSSYTFTFKRDGYGDVEKTRRAYLDGWYIGNLVFGGVLGFLLVDPDTGAMWRLDENPIGVEYLDANYQGGEVPVVVDTTGQTPPQKARRTYRPHK